MFSPGLLIICVYEWLGREVFQRVFLDLQKPYYLQQEFIKTCQTMTVHKKKGWFHLPVVSRGRSDSQHSLRGYYLHYLRKTGPFLGHLKVRATRPHLTLRKFIAWSYTLLKTCSCWPDTQPIQSLQSVWPMTLCKQPTTVLQLITEPIP